MDNQAIISQFLSLPESAKKEALLFMEFLLSKYKSEENSHISSMDDETEKRKKLKDLVKKNAGIIRSKTKISLESLRRENLYGEDER